MHRLTRPHSNRSARWLWMLAFCWTALVLLPAGEEGENLPLPIKPLVVPRVAVLEFDLNSKETEPALIRGLPTLAAALLRADLYRTDGLSVYPETSVRRPTDPAMAENWSVAKALPDANITIGGSLAPDPDNPAQYILKLRLYRTGRNPLIFTYANNSMTDLPGVIHEAAGDLVEELDLNHPADWKTRAVLPGKLMLPLAEAFESLSKVAVADPLSGVSATINAHEEGFKPVLADEGGKIGFIHLEMARRHPSPEAALEHLQTAIELDPSLAEAYFLAAHNHLDAQEAEEALDLCRAGLKAHSHFAELMMEMGRAYALLAETNPANRTEFLTSAGAVTVEALKLRPHSDLAWNDMGACEYDRGPSHRSRAEGCYLKAYELNPLNRNVLQNLTYFYAEQASFEKVRKFAQEALKLHPTDEEIAVEAARAEFALGDYSASAKLWQQAIDNGYLARRMPGYLGLCNALLAAGETVRAAEMLAAFLERAKEEGEDSFDLQRLQACREATEKRWVQLRANQSTAAFTQALGLMRTLMQNQRYDTARKQIESAFALADLPELYDTYVMLLDATDAPADRELARKLCARWRTEYPADPRAFFRQALLDKRDEAWQNCATQAAAGIQLLPALIVADPQKLHPMTMETHAGLRILAAQAIMSAHPGRAGAADTAAAQAARKAALEHLDAALKVLIPDCPLARDIQRMKIALESPAAD